MKAVNQKIKILHLEDQPTDAEQIAWLLRKSGMEIEVVLVCSKAEYKTALNNFQPDIILSDHSLPSFDSMEALAIMKQSGNLIPFILVTGTVSDEFAIKTMREGADDYLLKDRPQRLAPAILNAIEKHRLQREKRKAEQKIRETEKQYADLIQHLPANIAVLDKNGIVVDVNNSWKIFANENGFKGSNFGIGSNYIEVSEKASGINNEEQLPLAAALKEMVAGERSNFSMIYPCHAPKKNRWFKLIASRENKEHDARLVIMHINVTEQHEAQRQIEESEAKYRAFFENSIDGILLTVTDGQILAANPSACSMFQMTEEEICNVGRLGLIDSQDSRVRLLIEQRQLTGRAVGELTFIRKDGSRFPGEISSSVFIDANGQKRTSMIIRDRTEHKKAEEKLIIASHELKQLNNRLTLATRSAGMGIWDWDTVSGNLTWDEGMYQLYKIDTKQFGSIYEGWLTRLHVEDKHRVNEEIQFAISGKKEYDTEFKIEWPDQSVRYIKATGIVERDNEGQGIRMIGMNWDITKAKTHEETIRKSEAMLRNIDANSADMICSISEDGLFIHASAACETILGYTPDELIGKPLIDFVYVKDQAKTMEAALHLMKGNPLNNFENRYVRKDGSLVPLVWSVRWDASDRVRYGVARDASEIKRAEKMLAAERKRLSDLFMNAPVSMCILKGKEHVFELANPDYLRIGGKQDIIGKTGREAFPELEDQGLFELLDSIYETGIPFKADEMEIKIDRENNGQLTSIYQNVLEQPYRDADGHVAGIFYFGIDVTEQVLSRRKIEESEKRYRQIIETAQEGIWVIDEYDATTFVNNKMCEILEYSRDEMLGKEIYFFMEEETKKLANHSMQNRKQGKGAQYQLEYISKSKRKIWANISANPLFNEDGTYKGALAMINDITIQKTIEEENKKLATVASLTVNAVIVTDAEGKINWVNQGFERLTEYSFDEVIGKKPGQFLQGLATDSTTVARMRECVKHGQAFREEVLNYSKSGRQYWLDIEVVPQRDNHNKLTGFIAIEQDITDRKKSAHETLTLIDNLQKKNKDLQQFSYIVSHNLRAPIAKLMGLASILHPEQEENKFLIEKIAEESANLDEVVKDINLIVSARKSDKEKMEHVLFKTETLNVMQVLETEIETSGAIISYDFSEIKSVLTIKSYLYSILYNLISNAIKYRQPNKSSMIHVQSKKDERTICLIVKDNGMGIDLEKNSGKIFGLYKRFHGNEITGRGVGLHLAKTHAESLGGRVEVESKLNEGTMFKIYLPINYGKATHN